METTADWDKRSDFRTLLRENLEPFFRNHSYKLSYDNQKDESGKGRVFKLIFSGDKDIEISNNDWRDYTEYFHIYVNSQEIMTLNIDKFNRNNLEMALNVIKRAILSIIK